MNQDNFVRVLKESVKKSAIESSINLLEKPLGRNPESTLVEASSWYHNLDMDGKKMLKNIIEMAVDNSIFGFLCVIDGVRSVRENMDDEDGEFKLAFNTESDEFILNDPDDEYLHDIYNSI